MKLGLKLTVVVLFVLSAPHAGATERASFESDGVRIHCTIDGEGEPILLIHGYTANGAMNWRIPGMVKLLAKDYQVITMDVRGHGQSGKPESAEDYGVRMVQDAINLLDHLELDKVHVAGYSMGGMITLKLLAMAPERVKSAAVCGMGWYRPRPEVPGNGDGPSERNANPVMQAVAESFGELATTREEIQAMKTPVVAIVGDEDRGQLERVDNWKRVRPDLEVVYVEGANHVNCVFNPDFRSALKAFFDEQTSEE